jgi:hypothetical protein
MPARTPALRQTGHWARPRAQCWSSREGALSAGAPGLLLPGERSSDHGREPGLRMGCSARLAADLGAAREIPAHRLRRGRVGRSDVAALSHADERRSRWLVR